VWLWPYLGRLALLSYLGSFDGRDILPFGIDLIVVAIISLAVFYFAQAVGCRRTGLRRTSMRRLRVRSKPMRSPRRSAPRSADKIADEGRQRSRHVIKSRHRVLLPWSRDRQGTVKWVVSKAC
jgi:hypothetical protein